MRLRPQRSIRYVLLFVAALTLASVYAHANDQKPHKRDFKHQVEVLEDEWTKAQVAGDIAFMDRMLADDYLGISMSGQILTKQQQIERTRSKTLEITSFKLDDVKVKILGQAAIVTCTARVEGTNEGEPMNGTYRYTRVYQHLPNGAWRITNFEATRAPGHRDQAFVPHP